MLYLRGSRSPLWWTCHFPSLWLSIFANRSFIVICRVRPILLCHSSLLSAHHSCLFRSPCCCQDFHYVICLFSLLSLAGRAVLLMLLKLGMGCCHLTVFWSPSYYIFWRWFHHVGTVEMGIDSTAYGAIQALHSLWEGKRSDISAIPHPHPVIEQDASLWWLLILASFLFLQNVVGLWNICTA